MTPRRRPGRKILRSVLPILLILIIAAGGASAWIVYRVTHLQPHQYLVTPVKFTQLSARGVKATEETWANHDGTMTHGWLLRGTEGSPAVMLLHKYDADRSWLLNLGVKLNEQTNFTVLWPDLRGHGENPEVKSSSLGFREGEEAAAAVEYLRSLRTPQGHTLVGTRLGAYGVEMGAYAALRTAERDESIWALVLDSVPSSPNEILRNAVRTRLGVDNRLVQAMARLGMHAFLLGRYETASSCSLASRINNRSVLLLTGDGAGPFRDSTTALSQCFPKSSDAVDLQNSLPLTGFNLYPSTGEQEESYDRLVIDFFDKSLRLSQQTAENANTAVSP